MAAFLKANHTHLARCVISKAECLRANASIALPDALFVLGFPQLGISQSGRECHNLWGACFCTPMWPRHRWKTKGTHTSVQGQGYSLLENLFVENEHGPWYLHEGLPSWLNLVIEQNFNDFFLGLFIVTILLVIVTILLVIVTILLVFLVHKCFSKVCLEGGHGSTF